jgi:DNA-binding LytR/AlgR family response regulator
MAREGEMALQLCSEARPEAVFLDIRLPGQDGLALATHLTRLPVPPLLVFTTGHTERVTLPRVSIQTANTSIQTKPPFKVRPVC